MSFAGIAWTGEGFEVALRTARGAAAAPLARFPAGHVAGLTAYLCDLDRRTDHLVCIVESTNGMLDGGLMALGLRVYRADPAVLPSRPPLGSVDADVLARTGAERLDELTPLVLTQGSLTGRGEEHACHARDSEGVVTRMIAEGRCVRRKDADDRVVALTFDDGPNPPWTGRVLDVLERYDVPATFFCVGMHASGHPEELARMVEAGHGVGNHTWSHPFLPDLSPAELEAQLLRTDEAVERVTGVGYPRLFRPPYGSGTPEIFSRLRDDPNSTTVLWDVDTNDWAMGGAESITASILARTRPGSIVLMHDGGGDRSQTAEALPGAIEALLDNGYRFVTVRELLSSGRAARVPCRRAPRHAIRRTRDCP